MRPFIIQEYNFGLIDVICSLDDEAPVWLNARGDEKRLIWQTDKLELSNDSPLWLTGYPTSILDRTWYYPGERVTVNHCLTLAGRSDWKTQPLKPYASHDCSDLQYTLCQGKSQIHSIRSNTSRGERFMKTIFDIFLKSNYGVF